KVLDFGLAKQVGEAGETGRSGEAVAVSQSPTISFGATRTGVILGTAAYMSPEQVRGRPADKCSDVWAFGCVLYEMLTDRKAFAPATGAGSRTSSKSDVDDISDPLAAILRAEPDLSALPSAVPSHVRTIIQRCLDKDRKARIPDIAVVRFLLDGNAAGSR